MSIKVGDKAPSFTLPDTDKNLRTLSEFAGKKLLVAFYPGAFTSVCQKELCTFRDSITKMDSLGIQVVGISVDSPFANKAFAVQNAIQFPLLCDYTRTVCRQYGGLHEDFAGLIGYTAAKRAVFVIGKDGIIRYRWISEDPGIEPDYEEIKEILSIVL